MDIVLALALASGLASSDTLSDDALVAYASRPFDHAEKMGHHDTLGIHRGVEVLADFPCSDVCPNYTVRIIHYAVAPGPDCDRIGGRGRVQSVPISITSIAQKFCVPSVLVEKNLR